VVGPDGLSRFEDLRRREAAHGALLYAFDLIEHDGEDLRDLPFLDREAALARLLCDTEVGIVLNEHVEDGPTVFEHACGLGAEGIVSKQIDGTYQSGPWLWLMPAIAGVAATTGVTGMVSMAGRKSSM
jgi:bifunctional non-homologous end joining protein LigD